MVTFTSVQYPASASSTELSTTSYTRWCRPDSIVEPIYIAGRRRTASSPSSTLILLESYVSPGPGTCWVAIEKENPQSFPRSAESTATAEGKLKCASA